jgi:23S rRNA (cytidine1920-2'-O)/16S rRNA (cytidine1409-2'-O)-methyltransferase
VICSGGSERAERSRAKKIRLDERLVELGLESSRARAQRRIRAGDVRIGDRTVDKPGALIARDAVPTLRAPAPFVSRGGEKLAGALEDLGLDPAGLACVDVGASTGGFTDCLLQGGAASVRAIDVGYGQLATKLRDDPRVRVLERTNVRHLRPDADEPPVDLLTADLSFISLRLVLPRLRDLVRPGGRLLLLVKPQFELDRGAVGRGGVVRDEGLRREAVERVRRCAADLGLEWLGKAESRLAGPKGNREWFVLFLRRAEGGGGGRGCHARERT